MIKPPPHPPLVRSGAEPSHFSNMYTFQYALYTQYKEVSSTVRRPRKHCLSLRVETFKFSWGSMPPDPPRWLLNCFLSLKSEPPPHTYFGRPFPALVIYNYQETSYSLSIATAHAAYITFTKTVVHENIINFKRAMKK